MTLAYPAPRIFLNFQSQEINMPATSIIGIGSHHGADQLGWLVCEQLKNLDWPEAINIQLCRTPTQLPELLSHCENAILLDAIKTNTDSGKILSLQLKDLADNPIATHSSHGFGVTEALELTNALGQLPTSIIILAITIDDKTQDACLISPELLAELREVIKDHLI